MSGWIAPLVAAMVARREAEPVVISRFTRVRVRYDKRVKVPASSYYSKDYNVMADADGNFTIVPTELEAPAFEVRHSIALEFDSLDDAKPFVVREGMVLRATAFQERTREGEWDGYWQEIGLSTRGVAEAERAEAQLKA